MRYLSAAIVSVAKNPTYLVLFILFSMLGLPISILKQAGMVQGGLAIALMIVIYLVGLFLTTGAYSLAWKQLQGEKASFFTDSKKYFQHVLGASIVIGIIGAIVTLPFPIVHKMIFLPDISPQLYGKRIDANLVRTIPSFFVSVAFVYAIPAIFTCDLTGKDAVATSWKFLFKNLTTSKIAIAGLLISLLSRILLTQWAVNYDYSSATYWEITTLNNVTNYLILFLVFLCTAQIFKENYQKEEAI